MTFNLSNAIYVVRRKMMKSIGGILFYDLPDNSDEMQEYFAMKNKKCFSNDVAILI